MSSGGLILDSGAPAVTGTPTPTINAFSAPTTLSSLFVSSDLMPTYMPVPQAGPGDDSAVNATNGQSSTPVGIAVAIAVIIALVVLALVTLVFCLRRRKNRRILLHRGPSSSSTSSAQSWVGARDRAQQHYRDDSRAMMTDRPRPSMSQTVNKPLPPIRASTRDSTWQGRPRGLSEPEQAYEHQSKSWL